MHALMKFGIGVAFVILLAIGPCQSDTLPDSLHRHWLETDNKPVTNAGVTYFKIFDRICNPTNYEDGRGESDCVNGNVRSNLVGYSDALLGSSMSYEFDIWIQPMLAYWGWNNKLAYDYLHTTHDSKLRLASWEGDQVHNFIYMLKADSAAGMTFLGKVCQSPKDFGKWVHFSMQVKWSLENDGKIVVACDDTVLYQKKNIATAVNPHCYITNQCEPGKPKEPSRIIFLIGPVMAGHGPNWKKIGEKSQFVKIQDDGIEVRIRNFHLNIFHE